VIPALVGAALLVGALFSGAEAVVLGAHRLRLGSAAGRSGEGGGRSARFAADPSRVLATILVGNSLAQVFAASLATLWVARRWGEADVWIAVVVVAVLTLLVGEILPKSLARANADRLGKRLLPVVAGAYVVLRPWVAAVSRTAHALLAKAGLSRGPLGMGVTRQDLQLVLDESDELARLAPVQARILRRVFDFAETPVTTVMVPRTLMVAVPLGTTLAEAGRVMRERHLARLPVYREDLDSVVGVVYRLDLFRAPSLDVTVDGMARPVYLVPESKHCAELLREMQARRQHLAVVLDEYGGTAGLVTHEDLVEELVGEIRDRHETEQTVRRLDAFSVAVPGSMRLEELRESVGVALPEGDYETVAGLILEKTGRVPAPGEAVVVGRYRLEVLASDRRRIEQVAVRSERAGRRQG
jgi:CBS domain containing-hemolysin-like protein